MKTLQFDERDLTVCLLNDSFPPQIDGVANVISNYASIIHSTLPGSAIVATPNYPKVSDDYPYPVYRYKSVSIGALMSGYRAGIPFSPSLLEDIEKHRPQLIHSHCPFASNLLARVLREKLNIPIVFTYHTKFDVDIKNSVDTPRLQKSALKFMLANIESCDEVWAVSHAAGENLRSLGFKGEIKLMENGVDFPSGRVPKEHVEKLREESGLPENLPIFMYVGRMRWYKGIKISMDGLKIA